MSNADLEEIRQEHETWLAELEGLAVQAIASNNWDAFYAHVVDFQNEHDLHGESVIAIGENRPFPLNLGKYFPRFKDKAEASTKSLSCSGADLLPDQTNDLGDLTIMTKPVGYYASALATHPDSAILERIQEQFGSILENLTSDDKAAALICLVEKATNTQQVFIEENFFSNQNGEKLWQMARQLSPSNQLALSLAILEQILDGGQY